MSELVNLRTKLATQSWLWQPTHAFESLPLEIAARYSWLPPEISRWISEVRLLANPSQTAWFLGIDDYSGVSDSAYAWNEWELDAISWSDGDEELSPRFEAFGTSTSHCCYPRRAATHISPCNEMRRSWLARNPSSRNRRQSQLPSEIC
jgi:hypothetical protein